MAPALAAHPAELVAAIDDPAAVALIAAHRRALLWSLREPAVDRPLLGTRYELLCYLRQSLAFEPDEVLRAFFVDGGRRLIAEEDIARGGPAGIAVEPRQVLVRALLVGASGILLVHNHPSGVATPSGADRRFTRRLAEAGALLGIRLHDHLIVARDGVAAIDVAVVAPD